MPERAAVLTGRDVTTGEAIRLRIDSDGTITERTPIDEDGDLPLLAPGLVDLQVNGYAGHDVNAVRPDPDHIDAITDALALRGVTSWVPTVITAGEDEITDRIAAVTTARERNPVTAAAIPFVHVEGPFLSDREGARGVHDVAAIRPIDADEVERWRAAGTIGYITVSPHGPEAPSQIRRIVDSGVAVAIGHTHADHDQIAAAVGAGATLSTHLGNGIPATLPRHPNAIWSQLADDRLRCGLITDGHHLPAETVRVMLRAKRPGSVFCVSDAVELAGAAPGRYRTAVGGEVEVSADGRLGFVGTEFLAGSGADLARCLAWLVGRAGVDLGQAVELTSTTPGRIAGELGGTVRGSLHPGYPADVVELDDRAGITGVLRAGVRRR